jgi:hypothetical protein
MQGEGADAALGPHAHRQRLGCLRPLRRLRHQGRGGVCGLQRHARAHARRAGPVGGGRTAGRRAEPAVAAYGYAPPRLGRRPRLRRPLQGPPLQRHARLLDREEGVGDQGVRGHAAAPALAPHGEPAGRGGRRARRRRRAQGPHPRRLRRARLDARLLPRPAPARARLVDVGQGRDYEGRGAVAALGPHGGAGGRQALPLRRPRLDEQGRPGLLCRHARERAAAARRGRAAARARLARGRARGGAG